jgi:hypothetical protein
MFSLLKVIYNNPSLFQKLYLLNHQYIEKKAIDFKRDFLKNN